MRTEAKGCMDMVVMRKGMESYMKVNFKKEWHMEKQKNIYNLYCDAMVHNTGRNYNILTKYSGIVVKSDSIH